MTWHNHGWQKNVIKNRISKRASVRAQAKIKALSGKAKVSESRKYKKDDLEEAYSNFEEFIRETGNLLETVESSVRVLNGFTGGPQIQHSNFQGNVDAYFINHVTRLFDKAEEYMEEIQWEIDNWDKEE